MSKDDKLKSAVLAELDWEPSLKSAHIGVTAAAGVVTLTGHVDSFVAKHTALEATARVRGVLAVAQEIDVRLPLDTQRSDDDIAAAAIERLAWDVLVPTDAVQVLVDKGWVTLTGKVDWHYQREAAEQDLRRLHGVVGLSNQILVIPQVDTAGLGDAIRQVLHRSWFQDDKAIKVAADGGAVHLTGTVHSLHERTEAGRTAWAAPGTTDVTNDLVVMR